MLARHDEGRRLEAHVAALARALDASGRAGDDMVRQLAQDGDAALLVGLLARRAGIDQVDAWNFFTGGDAMLLARLAGCDRATARADPGRVRADVRAAVDRIIDRFDGLDDAAIERRADGCGSIRITARRAKRWSVANG